MDQILPHRLWIGHAGNGNDLSLLHRVGIEVLVQVAIEEPPILPPRELVFLRYPMIDGTGNRPEIIDQAVRSVSFWIDRHVPILVCCSAGLSRSPSIVAAALSRSGHGTPESCLIRLETYRRIDVSPGLWSEVRASLVPRLPT